VPRYRLTIPDVRIISLRFAVLRNKQNILLICAIVLLPLALSYNYI
jgi:hypothetical protein